MIIDQLRASIAADYSAATPSSKQMFERAVKVLPGGCSGFEYSMMFDHAADGDEVVEQHGVHVIVDRLSMPYLLGAEFDYEEGFQGAGFRINNPNSTGSCGCGKSFTA